MPLTIDLFRWAREMLEWLFGPARR